MRSTHAEASEALDEAADAFLLLRPRLLGIARRILGSAADAEDVLQDVWLRWQRTDRSRVLAPSSFLIRVTTRLAINVAQSAPRRRETCVGASPYGGPSKAEAGPEAGAERGEAVEMALLLLLQKLKPVERAAYVLRVAFEYPYGEIGEVLRVSQAYARQLVSRAHKHVDDERHRPVDTGEYRRFLAVFAIASQCGDMVALERFLSGDAASLERVDVGSGSVGCSTSMS
ncbi:MULTISPECIES: sigma-70 family RNA polymerase sigma factor [Streptomyces]|uniref:sigma-70 family RNA polymerase sigma factor n=1 Tax=Streptomyces TaxID=1883 RepID=UPI00240DFAD9|nr:MULTISPECIES: sigma-70 family RNA polymerase sigma factor [Streptomyces]WFB88562.1 sigma-70 family RNA polymerase sigma factor [Streptomyces olivaceus]WGK50703.1 sigma-70 family RNA polymerase sigma factor [Streptomyces sp. B146]